MGILNVTPDSCYDQGKWFDPLQAIKRGIQIYEEGADWLDIGGESTRPNAQIISVEEELKRVINVLKTLKKEIPIPISIDTMKSEVALAALSEGAQLINDVSGFRDPKMCQVAVQSQVPICIMHMHETPATMQNQPFYKEGIISFLCSWFKEKIEYLLSIGIKQENIIIDPGFGFGKTVADNVKIVQNLHEIQKLGFPVLVGLSRKSFLGKLIHKDYQGLLAATLAANTLAIRSDINFIRVHDVKEHREIIDLIEAMK